MKSYTKEDLVEAFRAVGLQAGDLVYLSTRLLGVGRMVGVQTRQEFLEAYFDAVMSVLGAQGTLVVPTFTQQVGRFGVPYVHEETVSLTGIFGEYVRMRPDSIRSLHPVFSVTAVGALKDAICADVSPVAFGYDSSFDRMVKYRGKAVCIGFEYYSGHIVSLMHYVETAFGVPYYYNKVVTVPVFCGGKLVERVFVINVKYLNLRCEFDYRRYIDTMASRNHISKSPFGENYMYAASVEDMVADGTDLLKQDMYAFLAHPPVYEPGAIPYDGPQLATSGVPKVNTNWEGYFLGL